MDFTEKRVLGRTGMKVSRIGLASGYKVPGQAVEKAYHEYGINYFYFESRKPGMRNGLRQLIRTGRENVYISVQSYDHLGFWLKTSLERALQSLETDYVDVLYLGWFNRMPPARLLAAAQTLKEQGKVRYLGMSGHNRDFHGQLAANPTSPIDIHMIRYNAAHRGAERDVFTRINKENPPGITTYTATRWGQLLKEAKMPAGEKPLTAADCYRFVLSYPTVDLALAGPRSETEMDQGMEALALGPLDSEEMARIKRIGDHLHRT